MVAFPPLCVTFFSFFSFFLTFHSPPQWFLALHDLLLEWIDAPSVCLGWFCRCTPLPFCRWVFGIWEETLYQIWLFLYWFIPLLDLVLHPPAFIRLCCQGNCLCEVLPTWVPCESEVFPGCDPLKFFKSGTSRGCWGRRAWVGGMV